MSETSLSPLAKDLKGLKFGRWLVLEFASRGQRGRLLWNCRCECGQVRQVFGDNLTSGRSKSCGCLLKEIVSRTSAKHGFARVGAKTPEYLLWEKMIYRCTNRNSPNWPDYGGRGIKVCDRWRNFVNFHADMGKRPSPKHMLERINNNGNYEPGNVVWATRLAQANNKRNNRLLTFNGETHTMAQWSRITGIRYFTLSARIRSDWPAQRALTEPVGHHFRSKSPRTSVPVKPVDRSGQPLVE